MTRDEAFSNTKHKVCRSAPSFSTTIAGVPGPGGTGPTTPLLDPSPVTVRAEYSVDINFMDGAVPGEVVVQFQNELICTYIPGMEIIKFSAGVNEQWIAQAFGGRPAVNWGFRGGWTSNVWSWDKGNHRIETQRILFSVNSGLDSIVRTTGAGYAVPKPPNTVDGGYSPTADAPVTLTGLDLQKISQYSSLSVFSVTTTKVIQPANRNYTLSLISSTITQYRRDYNADDIAWLNSPLII